MPTGGASGPGGQAEGASGTSYGLLAAAHAGLAATAFLAPNFLVNSFFPGGWTGRAVGGWVDGCVAGLPAGCKITFSCLQQALGHLSNSAFCKLAASAG